jgi:hypothetical protein
VISTTLSGDTPAQLRLTWRTKPQARQALELYGKRILLTDKDKRLASTSTIVTDYRSQEDAEADFRQNPEMSASSSFSMIIRSA